MECATRLCSTEMLLGIISFSPAKGRGEASQLLMAFFFQRGCFPSVRIPFPQCTSPLEIKTFPTGLGALCSRAVMATPTEGLGYNNCPTAVHRDIPGHAHPSLLPPAAIHPDTAASSPPPRAAVHPGTGVLNFIVHLPESLCSVASV